jgi:ribA/ribD-fused uncharacterized protein
MSNWFSNFQPFDKPLICEGIRYITPEHYYQALKTLDLAERLRVAQAPTAGAAKKLGKRVKLRPDWEGIKVSVMQSALEYKFRLGTSWHLRLMNTPGEIVEWNTWHDNFWGDCTCYNCKSKPGLNYLGRLLMILRDGEKRELYYHEASDSYFQEYPSLLDQFSAITSDQVTGEPEHERRAREQGTSLS